MRWLIACLLSLMTAAARSDWQAPDKPDPSAILQEAQADAKAHRYRDALAKQLWFHHNALKHERAFYGVRLSFALEYWLELGRHHPPALQALKEVRDQAGSRARERLGNWEDFHDFSAINEVLGDEQQTVDLFVWLDQHNPALAKRSYSVAENALIRAEHYQLCGKYIDTAESLKMMLHVYRDHQRMAEEPRFGAEFKDYAEKSFTHSARTLVALLALNNRAAEAEQVVTAVLKEKPDETFKSQLNAAKNGELPEPWPTRAQ